MKVNISLKLRKAMLEFEQVKFIWGIREIWEVIYRN